MCYDWTWKKFIHFLKTKNCYEQYVFNYNNMDDRWKRDHFSKKHHIKLYNATEYICVAFEWVRTNEGHDYWALLDTEWCEIAEKFIQT